MYVEASEVARGGVQGEASVWGGEHVASEHSMCAQCALNVRSLCAHCALIVRSSCAALTHVPGWWAGLLGSHIPFPERLVLLSAGLSACRAACLRVCLHKLASALVSVT